MRSSKSGSLTLGPMGQKGGGDTFCLIFSLLLEQSVHTKASKLVLMVSGN